MNNLIGYLGAAVLVGLSATLVMDLWSIIRQRLLGIAPLDYALVGRWLIYLTHGRFFHTPIQATPAISGERAIGWIFHYLTGVLFALVLLLIAGASWLEQPSLGPALAVGLGSMAAPFLLLQPALGAGVAARNTPRPNAARIQSLVTHLVFGFGLYAGGWLTSLLIAAAT